MPSSHASRYVVAVALAVGILGVALRIHGFSFPIWAEMLDGDHAPPELVAGKTRWVRTDDFAVSLPLMLAQVSHDPPFPVVNTNIADGQNMLVIANVPVWHPLGLLRPQTWGFFLGGDFGLAWLWSFRLIGIFVMVFLLLREFCPGRVLVPTLGGIGVAFSPFLQYWALGSAEFYIWACALVVLSSRALFGGKPREVWTLLPLLAWSLACFVQLLYPAYQLYAGYSALALLGSLLLLRRSEWPLIRLALGAKVAVGLCAVALAAASVWLLLRDAGDAVTAMAQTVYPGSTKAAGGGLGLLRIFSNYFYIFRANNLGDVFFNECEAAGFVMVAPCALVALARAGLHGHRRELIASVPLLVLFAMLMLWAMVGFPSWLATATLLDRAPSYRVTIGFGLINIAMLALAASVPPLAATSRPRVTRVVVALAFALWIALVAWTGGEVARRLSVSRDHLLVSGAVVLLIGFMTLRRVWVAALLFALMSIKLSWGFNPVVRGGFTALRQSSLPAAVTLVDGQWEGKTRWLVVGNWIVPNLFRMLGLQSFNGNMYYPQWELWRRLDPTGASVNAYNRYAHVVVQMREEERERFSDVIFDSFTINVIPRDPLIGELGVTHILAVGPEQAEILSKADYPLIYRHSRFMSVFAAAGTASHGFDPRDQRAAASIQSSLSSRAAP